MNGTRDHLGSGPEPGGGSADVLALFDQHFDLVHRFIAARAGATSADDLASEVFLIAYRRRADFDPGATDGKPWLMGIAVRVLSTHFRGLRRRGRLLQRIAGAQSRQIVEATAGMDAILDPVISEALTRLRPQEREVLLLSAWAEMTYEEIAAALGVPLGTVRSRLSRARTALRDALGNPARENPDGKATQETGA